MADDREATRVTRRTVLGAGITGALACFVSAKGLAAIVPLQPAGEAASGIGRDPGGAELYIFRSAQPGKTVIALTWPKRARGAGSRVSIHAGSRSWVVEIPARNSEWQQDQASLFCGTICLGALHAFVVELPHRLITAAGPVGVWAEWFKSNGIRQRTGSPFLAKILAENDTIAATYHAISPSQDRRILTEDVARAIAAKTRIQDPAAYGRRLASVLLPDVLHYDPAHPPGFTFAARNGRHPLDDSAVVVNSILSGSSAPASTVAAGPLKKHFPYFTPSPDFI